MKATITGIGALVAVIMALLASSCHEIESYDNDIDGNFDALWTLFDEHYCFFREKNVDWDSVREVYVVQARQCRTQRELFQVCADMINVLRDGHVNLSSWFETSYYRQWWSDYPQNFNERVVEENYLHFQYKSLGPAIYGILPQNIGYLRLSTFASGLGEGNLDAILNYFFLCDGLIIDVRDNGGGAMNNVETIVSRFITRKTLAGYIVHKTGPGHDDFSEPFAYYYSPQPGRVLWHKGVAVLTNRSTFSAANNFVSVMKSLDGVSVVGARTGGGSGMPMSYEIPAGWSVRMSASPVLDPAGNATEFGVDPTPGCEVDITADDTAAGRDPIIDRAVEILTNGTGGITDR